MKGGAFGQERPMQKRSKKDGCSAKMKIISYVNNPESVSDIHMNTHNHNVGSTEELQHLPLSNDVKNYIIDHLRHGYDKRDIRISIQNNFKEYVSNYLNFSVVEGNDPLNMIIHKDQMIHSDDIYNLYKNIQQEKYQRDKNQYESVKL
ncbi:MAG: hypothetical protein EXX96DRAFT_551630 [Benjaminiella poitrasii]|nr:MAG: hypothetical protein EXX96DRAFT_551630 [Benjaminiella poitrasii]